MSEQTTSIISQLREAIVGSTTEVFETMLSLSPKVINGTPTKDNLTAGDVVGIIGIVGKTLKGSIMVHMNKTLASKATSIMLDTPLEELTEEYILDAAGEIANMIAGSTKAQGEHNDILFDISVPTVVTGNEYTVNFKDKETSSFILFEVDSGHLKVGFCIENG